MKKPIMAMTLTSEQLSVVNLVSGRHLVLAPPGSGKTEMLSQRIVRALDAGVDPKKMLCATFTNRAAFEMRERVAGAAGPARKLPDVGNLHHFCHRFLLSVRRLHPGKHVLDESQQLDFIHEVTDALRKEPNAIVEELLAGYEEEEKSPYPDILSAVLISHQWRLGIPACYLRQIPPQVRELVECGVIAKLERAYTGLKRKFQFVDFDDLVNETFLYLTKNPLDDDRRFDWVQVDEVQDLNPLQWRIVKELTSARAVSVYFGDVEQSIFSFLGASASTFSAAVADCERHFFKTNFRATPLLLEILMRFSLDALRSEWEFLPAPSDVTRERRGVAVAVRLAEGRPGKGAARSRRRHRRERGDPRAHEPRGRRLRTPRARTRISHGQGVRTRPLRLSPDARFPRLRLALCGKTAADGLGFAGAAVWGRHLPKFGGAVLRSRHVRGGMGSAAALCREESSAVRAARVGPPASVGVAESPCAVLVAGAAQARIRRDCRTA